MPLMAGKSKAAFSHNVGAEMESGKPQKQAVAIAFATKRRAMKRARKMADGGTVTQPAPKPKDTDYQAGMEGSPGQRLTAWAQGLIRGKYKGGFIENEKLHPLHEAEGGLIEDDETFPEQGEGERSDAFLSEDMDPETSGLADAETDTYPANGTEHEIDGSDEDKGLRKLRHAFATMWKNRRAGAERRAA